MLFLAGQPPDLLETELQLQHGAKARSGGLEFALQQARESYRFLQAQISDCDVEVDPMLSGWEAQVDLQQQPLPPTRKKNRSKSKHKPLPFILR